MRYGVWVLVSVLTCSACTFRFLDTEMRAHGGFMIRPYTPEFAARNGPGFVVTMYPELATQLGAPDGEAFKEMLEKRLAEERARGNDYCPHGYDIVEMLRFKHYYTKISADCKSK